MHVKNSDGREKHWIRIVKDQIANKGVVGKPLTFSWFREKKCSSKRLFFIVSKRTRKAVLLTFLPKWNPRALINEVIKNRTRYLNLLR